MAFYLEDMIIKAANPAVPFIAVTLYWTLSKPVCNQIRKDFSLEPKGYLLQGATLCHSFALALYSAWTCYNCLAVVVPRILEQGFWGALCDTEGVLWNSTKIGFLINLFYLSKYYEFIDTWIVLLKGREPIFLQTYHHAGIVVLMWALCVTEATASGAITTILNSFIHTLMYTYYVLAAFGIPCPFKRYITMAQIVQFLVGIVIIMPTYTFETCMTTNQKVATIGLQTYAVVLIYLFYIFYIRNYEGKNSMKIL